jgi:uncharacterized protein DUF5666
MVMNTLSSSGAVAPSDLTPLSGFGMCRERVGMKRMRLLGMPLVAVAVLVLTVGVRSAGAQTKEARGTVAAVSDSSLTIKAGERDLTFVVNADTKVEASGAGRQTRQVRAAGGTGIKFTEFVKTGRPVLVTYREANGTNQAVSVRAISAAGPGGGSTSDEAAKIASGKVTSITTSALTIASNGQNLTFAVDAATIVAAARAGRATKAAGGRIPITDLVGNGDMVSVTYRNAGTTLSASQVRITVKSH